MEATGPLPGITPNSGLFDELSFKMLGEIRSVWMMDAHTLMLVAHRFPCYSHSRLVAAVEHSQNNWSRFRIRLFNTIGAHVILFLYIFLQFISSQYQLWTLYQIASIKTTGMWKKLNIVSIATCWFIGFTFYVSQLKAVVCLACGPLDHSWPTEIFQSQQQPWHPRDSCWRCQRPNANGMLMHVFTCLNYACW